MIFLLLWQGKEWGCLLATSSTNFNPTEILFKNCFQNWNKQGLLNWLKEQQLVLLEKLFLPKLRIYTEGYLSKPIYCESDSWCSGLTGPLLALHLQSYCWSIYNAVGIPSLVLLTPALWARRQTLLSHVLAWSQNCQEYCSAPEPQSFTLWRTNHRHSVSQSPGKEVWSAQQVWPVLPLVWHCLSICGKMERYTVISRL